MHLRPTAPIAARALLPGDPGRALALAQELLDRPRMCNHHRGLWGYTGTTPDGRELTIQATGIGGPSAALVLADLAGHGVRRAVRLGTCAALADEIPLGALLAAEDAVAIEGASASLGAGATASPDRALQRRLLASGDGSVVAALVASLDLPPQLPGLDRDEPIDPRAEGAVAVEMGTATLFTLGARLGIAVASALVVARSATGEELDDEAVERGSLELGAVALDALG